MAASTGSISGTTAPSPGTASTVAASPTPRRLRGPSWLDLRLIVGVLLVLASVVVGARVVGAADESVTVWAAARDLSAGTTLRSADVRLVQVRLFDAGPVYLGAEAELPGRVLDRPVRSGELLPASSLGSPSDRVSVALPVPGSGVPFDLTRGQLVDVYATGPDSQGGPDVTRLVLAAAPVQAVDGENTGVLSSAGGLRQIVVSVPSTTAGELVAAIAGRDLALAILDSLAVPADRSLPTGPAGTPAAPSPSPPEATTGSPPGATTAAPTG